MAVIGEGDWNQALRAGWNQGKIDLPGIANGMFYLRLIAESDAGEVSEPFLLKMMILR